MNAIAFLLALLALAYVGSILVGGRAIRGFGLASGAEYLVLGFVLGPQLLSVVSHSLIDGFQAVIMVGVSWLGLVLGVSYLRVAVRKVPLRRVESEAGWGQMKKNTRMVAEGSVLVSLAEPRGAAADVAPDDFAHPVYRAGFAVSLPVPLKVPA